jgi:hypothetical protein
MGKSRRIQNRRENRDGPSRNSFEEAKGREITEKERGGDRNKTVYFFFYEEYKLYKAYRYIMSSRFLKITYNN